jgi:hypothetical protein
MLKSIVLIFAKDLGERTGLLKMALKKQAADK